jgi:hypothetical protein
MLASIFNSSGNVGLNLMGLSGFAVGKVMNDQVRLTAEAKPMFRGKKS